ncbi:translocation/assembly module TamB domain-containing protein [Prevotella sp. A2931]|uniref:Translocation/assembly module TamB domain-containing protein n=1 Tax=Prevotella illustrans TaxID=2800387 RepID=A0ABS3M894_9BACT|nr:MULTISPECIES: translocation/assembly module TamB domain-containing protein [Prevotella]MBO1364340.1 translocation/assembly module TamB domain-containing protein [Prevotella illustrans]PTL25453.1 phage tail protein [Prevotella sp. oral taxon 820]
MNNKIVKWIGFAVIFPILLFSLCCLLFYFPPFQNWAVKQVAYYASAKTGMDISVARVNLEFPFDLGVEDVRVIRQNDSLPQLKDTVADIHKTVVSIELLPLLNKRVVINQLDFQKLHFNTTTFIHAACVKGRVGQLKLKARDIDIGKQLVKVDDIRLSDAGIDVALSDTVKEDTTHQDNFWKIAVGQLKIDRANVMIRMPGDSLRVRVYAGKAIARQGFFDLYKNSYRVASFDWEEGRLKYDNPFESAKNGFDYNHLAVSNIRLGVDSFEYASPKLTMRIRCCSLSEKSGLVVSSLTGPVCLDSVKLQLPAFSLQTPASRLDAAIDLDLNAFDNLRPGQLKVSLHGSLGKQDIMRFLTDVPAQVKAQWPNYPLRLDGVVRGNPERVRLVGLLLKLPTAFRVRLDGTVSHLNQPKILQGYLDLRAQTYNLAFLSAFMNGGQAGQVKIPHDISVDGHIRFDKATYAARFMARQGSGSLNGTLTLDTRRMAYNARLTAHQLPLQRFLPKMGLRPFTGFVDANGVGTDFLLPTTRLNAKVGITRFSYGGYRLDGVKGDVKLRNGRAHATLQSSNPLVGGNINLTALMDKRRVKATVQGTFAHLDFYGLRLTEKPFSASAHTMLELETDLKDYYSVRGAINELIINDNNHIYRPENFTLNILTRSDTTHAVVNCGDFRMRLDGHGGYRKLLARSQKFADEIEYLLKNRTIDQLALRKNLPLASLYLQSGKNNFFCHLLARYGYQFAKADVNMNTSPILGLNGSLQIDSLILDSIRLDTVRFNIMSDHDAFTYRAQVVNNKRNPQYTFRAEADGALHEHGSYLKAKLYDAKNKLGLDLGLSAVMEPKGLRIHIMEDNPILGYKKFTVNTGNYVFLGDDRRLSATLELEAADGTGVHVYTDDNNLEALQDVTVSLNKFNLSDVLSVLPYTPNIKGVLNGDYHLIQTQSQLSVSSDMTIDNLFYENNFMGNLGTEFVYMPKSDGSHYLEGILSQNGNEVATLKGTYWSEGVGKLDARLSMERLPLSFINGFIPNQLLGFQGYAEGTLTVEGSLSKPIINGEAYLDSAYLVSVPYGVTLRFDNDPVAVHNSHLLFENFEMYAYNDSPLNMSGYLDFSDLNNMNMDVRMRAQNFELINAKENLRSEAFGKAFVNFFARMNGRVDNLQMRGKLDVLGSTDMTYILRDSPLTTDNQLDELVKFTDFSDSTKQEVRRPPLSGFSMDLAMSINESAHVLCALNADKSNYVDLIGGGELRMQYNTVDALRLTGRYTLSNGEMKYSLPVIPLKTFTIQDGSYIEFMGDAMNPRLNIKAVEQNKATVATAGSAGRTVNFETGVVITKTLKNMGLEFIIDAPEDMSISNQLNTMSKEERGKIAVTMLTTGMYLADGNTNGFSMNSALSAFLQSQINSIAGNALRTLDLTFGMDNSTDAGGNTHTDYSFKFSKRFWNNRLRIIVGGELSTGPDVANQNKSFFDNISFEYRLNEASTQYLKLFYDRANYDWLEGDAGQYGAGFVWRRKLRHLKDLFRFKESNLIMLPAPSDSVKQQQPKK